MDSKANGGICLGPLCLCSTQVLRALSCMENGNNQLIWLSLPVLPCFHFFFFKCISSYWPVICLTFCFLSVRVPLWEFLWFPNQLEHRSVGQGLRTTENQGGYGGIYWHSSFKVAPTCAAPPRLTPPTHSFTPQFSIINFYVGLIKLILEMFGLERVYCGLMNGKLLAIQISLLLAQLVQICGHSSYDCTLSYSTNVYYIFRPYSIVHQTPP